MTTMTIQDERTDILLYPHSHIPNSEWSMCTLSEAQERSSCNELSIFECTESRRTRKPNPYRCVKKYRRSAAGGGISTREVRKRSIDELETSVLYLLGGVFTRQRPPKLQESHSYSDDTGHSLHNTVNFVDDRIRAVQVDLTIMGDTLHSCRVRRLQIMIVKYHILSQYLLFSKNTDAQKKNVDYEWTFAMTALRTSLSAYLDTWRYHGRISEVSNKQQLQDKDEIMSYVCILHTAAVVRYRENAVELSAQSSDRPCGMLLDDGDGIQALLSFFRKYEPDQRNPQRFPKFFWALKLAAAIEDGNFISVLRMLTKKLRKLLCNPRTSFVIGFCKSLGLSISTRSESEYFVSMKTTAISFQSTEAVDNVKYPPRKDFLDPFVFGTFDAWLRPTLSTNHNSDVVTKDEASMTLLTMDWGHLKERIDENGTLIPPSPVLWELIR